MKWIYENLTGSLKLLCTNDHKQNFKMYRSTIQHNSNQWLKLLVLSFIS